MQKLIAKNLFKQTKLFDNKEGVYKNSKKSKTKKTNKSTKSKKKANK